MFGQSDLLTYIYRPSILHPGGDERSPAGVNVVLLIGQFPFYQLAVNVNGDNVALHGNAQLVPLAIKQGLQVSALKCVAEGVLQLTLEGKLHRLLAAVDHNGHLRSKETAVPSNWSSVNWNWCMTLKRSVTPTWLPPDWSKICQRYQRSFFVVLLTRKVVTREYSLESPFPNMNLNKHNETQSHFSQMNIFNHYHSNIV